MAQEKHLSSHVSAHGSGACCCDNGMRVCTDLASSVEWAYETAIVGGICENVGKFSTLLSRSSEYLGQCGDARCVTDGEP